MKLGIQMPTISAQKKLVAAESYIPKIENKIKINKPHKNYPLQKLNYRTKSPKLTTGNSSK